MPEYMMLMKGNEQGSDVTYWEQYINTLTTSGMFRGGSALGNGACVSQKGKGEACVVSGFMRFDAASIEQVLALIPGNSVYESGGEVEVLELLKT